MSFCTAFPIWYREKGLKAQVLIPEGTPCRKAEGYPRPAYWACEWSGMSEGAKIYLQSRGFLLLAAEVCEELPNFESP